MAFTQAKEITEAIKTVLTAPLTALVTGISINLDEPINLVYTDLPCLAIYPLKEDFVYDESFSTDKKHLQVRIELRMKSGPSSKVCTPVINVIADTLKANPKLGGLVHYMELQTIQWANADTSSGTVSGASLDVLIQYLI